MTDNTPERPENTPAPSPAPAAPAPAPAPAPTSTPPAPDPTPTQASIPTPAATPQPPFPTAPWPASYPVPAPTGLPQPRPRKRGALIAIGVVAVLLVGGGVTWWALTGDGDPTSHAEVSGGKLVSGENDMLDEGEECDDTDEFSYNDCDADTSYEFIYKITNEGDEPANYTVIVNGFDEDGDFVGQTYIGATHLEPGKSDADTGDFDEYSELDGNQTLSDIESIEIAHVERLPLAN